MEAAVASEQEVQFTGRRLMVNQTLYYHNDDITKGVWRGRGQPFFPHQASCPLLTALEAVSISMENQQKIPTNLFVIDAKLSYKKQ